jgi:hypothetical protein
MTSPVSFQGPLPGRRGRGPAALIVLVVAFLVIAVAKPWSAPAPAPPLAALPATVAPSSSSSSSSSPAPSLASMSSAPSFVPGGPIVLDAPPPAGSAWTAIRWRRLEPGDPLATLRLVRHAAWGYLAVGAEPPRDPTTQVWTSPDGATWTPVSLGSASALYPGTVVAGVGVAAGNLVVLTVLEAACVSDPSCFQTLGVDAWTSSDGGTWTPHHVPEVQAGGPWPGVVHVAYGPRGLVVAWPGGDASGGPGERLAISIDGTAWQVLPAASLPRGLFVVDLVASGDGYLALGRTPDTAGSTGSIVLRSADGRTWRRTELAGSSSLLVSLVTFPGGFVALGRDPATGEIVRWWRSTDGARWTPLAGYPPLGPAACRDGCGVAQDGLVIGDGTRLLAMRGGPDAAAWTSSDGSTWGPLRMTGDIPPAFALALTMLPGGALATDGTTTWYGAATGG